MAVDLPDTLELIEISSNDEEPDDQFDSDPKEEDPEEYPVEDPGMAQPDVEQGIEDVRSAQSNTNSSSDSGEEPEYEFDSNYDPFQNPQDDLALFYFGYISLWSPIYVVQLGYIVTF